MVLLAYRFTDMFFRLACIHRSEGFFLRSFHSLVHVHSFAFSQPSIRGHQRDVPASKDLGIFHMGILGSNLGKGGVWWEIWIEGGVHTF